MKIIPLLMLLSLLVTACGDSKLFWKVEEGASRGDQAALVVPPELRNKAEGVAAPVKGVDAEYQASISGNAVDLGVKDYALDQQVLLNTAVKALAALNVPVKARDDALGLLTTGWVKRIHESNGITSYIGFAILDNFASDKGDRYRFLVKVYPYGNAGLTRLEVRTLSQVLRPSGWVNKRLEERVDGEIFAKVDELVSGMSPQP